MLWRLLMLVEARSGIAVAFGVKPGSMPAREAIGIWLFPALQKGPGLPSRIIISNPRWGSLFEGISNRLGIELRLAKRLPALEEAVAHLEQCLIQGG